MSKISGPMLDRIDIHIEVPAVPFRELSGNVSGTSSAQVREEAMTARRRQAERFHGKHGRVQLCSAVSLEYSNLPGIPRLRLRCDCSGTPPSKFATTDRTAKLERQR
jgi:magnesium chelatase family protein